MLTPIECEVIEDLFSVTAEEPIRDKAYFQILFPTYEFDKFLVFTICEAIPC